MGNEIKVLFAGESIYSSTTNYKGWNSFHLGKFLEHGEDFINALESNGITVDYMPTHFVQEKFPWTLEELKQYDAIAISDVSSDSFNLSEKTMAGVRM